MGSGAVAFEGGLLAGGGQCQRSVEQKTARTSAGNAGTFRIPTAYHKAITQEFRRRWPYGTKEPSANELRELLVQVYSRYPIPQLVGIEP